MKTYQNLVLITVLLFVSFLVKGQPAPLCIENFENYCDFTYFQYQEEPVKTPCFQSTEISGPDVLEGNTSLRISWNLSNCNYFGWGVDFTAGNQLHGYTVNNEDTLSFLIKLTNGNEKFRINFKDTDNNQRGFSSELFVQPHTKVQLVKIPISRLHRSVSRASLKDINFAFSSSTASIQGNIIIDDFKHIFK